MKKKIAIVGAGVAGLALASRLAYKDYSVEVFEKLPSCGGRNNLLTEGGFKFDMGPSFVLMPDFFEEVFSYCGESLNNHLNLKSLEVSYKLFYPDSDTFTVYRDSVRTREEVERIARESGHGFDKFIKATTILYEKVRPLLYRCFTPSACFNPLLWPLLKDIRPFQSYWDMAKEFFPNEKLCYAFTFEAMFMGVSPFDAPAFYSIISYTDHVQKIYHPLGGMYEIPRALEALAKRFGAKFHYNCEIKNIRPAQGALTIRANGLNASFDDVAINADYAYAKENLLSRNLKSYRYSCSVYLIYLGLKQKVKGLEHHNLFFSKDLVTNLDQIFKTGDIPYDPSFYTHVPTVTDSSLAPQGKDILYILVPVPNLEKAKSDMEASEEVLRKTIFEKVSKIIGSNLEDLIEVERHFYPRDFLDRYNIKHGATFGLAHNLMQSAFFRPANFDQHIKNLYYVGASVQPGGGLPVVIASSRIVADLVEKNV